MAALAAAKEANKRAGDQKRYLLKASTTIYKGALVCLDTNGLAVPAADTASFIFVGVAYETATSAASGSTYVTVEKRGEYEMVTSGATQATTGKKVFASDDQTVATSTTNSIAVGYDGEFVSATKVRVRIDNLVQ